MEAPIDVLEMKATGDVVGTETKTREEVIEEVIMEWQRLAEVLREPQEAYDLEYIAQYDGLLTWQQAYENAKSALKRFGLQSKEYRIAKKVLEGVGRRIVRPYDERFKWNAESLQEATRYEEKYERLLAKKDHELTFCEHVFLEGGPTEEEQKFLAKIGREGMCNEEFGPASEA